MTELLDLSKIFDRHTVNLGGKVYELRNHAEFSIVQDTMFGKLMQQMRELEKSGDDSEEAAATAAHMVRELATLLVVDLDREIPDVACVAIFEFWIENQGRDDSGGNAQKDPPVPRKRPTTGASSRGSKRSTAATRKRGSTPPRRGR